MEKAQGGKCKVCRRDPADVDGHRYPRLFVDHDHQTGAVRGLLCHGCNTAAGHLSDDPERAVRLAEYLREHAEGRS
jgi:hypothetical protein